MFCSLTIRSGLLIAVLLQIGHAAEAKTMKQLGDQERVILFVIRQESAANALETRRDVCVGFGGGLSVNENAILSSLRGSGLKFHSGAWCNRGPRGVKIGITAPVKQTSPGVYELTVEFGDMDPIRLYGEHFATLLRKSTYVVECENGSEPALKSYLETCCTDRPIHQLAQPPN
jgi:hypothetical protein